MPEFTLKNIHSLANHLFYVEKYQRGYKWDIRQVLELLNDILEFEYDSEKDNFYCLQPIVLKQRTNDGVSNTYELIDGQQRMTTIYLIQALAGETIYELDYNTRKGSKAFLEQVAQNRFFIPIINHRLPANQAEMNDLKEELDNGWEGFCNQKGITDNVDNYHFYIASHVILLWLNTHNTQIPLFLNNLSRHTKVIWYEISPLDDPETVFMNLNSGKISLSPADLTKALFLLDSNDPAIQRENPTAFALWQNEMASEWDRIEFSLHDPEFWYFLKGSDSKKEYPRGRIGLLLDMLAGNFPSSSDKLFTYRYFTEQKNRDWEKVKDLFLTLNEWFRDPELYRYIGFLVSVSQGKTVYQLWKDKGKYSKSAFLNHIKGEIRERYKDDSFDLESLNYPSGKIHEVLLLFNLETYCTEAPDFRFPFHRFHLEKWSLEHVHATNTKKLETTEEKRTWLVGAVALLKLRHTKNARELEKNAQDMLTESAFEGNQEKGIPTFEQLEEQLVLELGEFTEKEELDKIGNMALLDPQTNSSLSNGLFPEKRKRIIEILEQESWSADRHFLPLATKNVFFKYYSPENMTIPFWGARDRENYKNAIYSRLKSFINHPKPIPDGQ